jgi:hypothetical protein
VGTLCVVDTKPRHFTPELEACLSDLRASLEEILLLRTLQSRTP